MRWVVSADTDVDKLNLTSTTARGYDAHEHHVLFFENDWSIRLACEKNKNLELAEIAPRESA